MATKVQKRRVRREREAQELGLNKDNQKTKEQQQTLEEQKMELKKWVWFFITCGLLWFIYTFGAQG